MTGPEHVEDVHVANALVVPLLSERAKVQLAELVAEVRRQYAVGEVKP